MSQAELIVNKDKSDFDSDPKWHIKNLIIFIHSKIILIFFLDVRIAKGYFMTDRSVKMWQVRYQIVA